MIAKAGRGVILYLRREAQGERAASIARGRARRRAARAPSRRNRVTRLPRVRHRRADPARRRPRQDPPDHQLSAPHGQPAGLRPRDRRVRADQARRAQPRAERANGARGRRAARRAHSKSARQALDVEGVDQRRRITPYCLARRCRAAADAGVQRPAAVRCTCGPARTALPSLSNREPVAPATSIRPRTPQSVGRMGAERRRDDPEGVGEEIVLAAAVGAAGMPGLPSNAMPRLR